ncbi:MAG: UDP-3-O-(3-hydroxymyristoyl)glucosamine N-acyltransferase [Gammaproteobacteria bacterium]|nr:MAG: UDP-3-O-(3-hydroxymyristoyl)glucosamine N-acyltransferase [Gammaproteobacteria bacterium]
MTLAALAVRHGCELHGDPDVTVDHVATLAAAGPGALAFLANPRYRAQLAGTRASAVVLDAESAAACPTACLVSSNPYLAYARLAADLHPLPPPRPGVAAGARVAESARLGAGTQVDAGAVIGEDAVVGARVVIGANAVIGAGCAIGDDTRIMAAVVLCERVRIGRRCLVHPGAVIGSDGFGNARGPGGAWTRVPQLGSVVIGDDVSIGACTTIDRGAIEDTSIGDGVRLDNHIQVGHNVSIGSHTAIAAMTGISGSTRIGARCIIGGHCGFAGHIVVADDVVISGGAKVTNSIGRPGLYSGAIPADEARQWRKNAVRFGQLDQLARRLRQLEGSVREPGRKKTRT